MSSSIYYRIIILFFALAVISSSDAAKFKKPKPKALLFAIRKDTKSLQYYTSLEVSQQGNYVEVVMDLGGQTTWFSCDANRLQTYKPIKCGSTKCKEAKSTICLGCNPINKRGCTNKICGAVVYNPFTDNTYPQAIREDAFFVDSTNGLAVGPLYQSPEPLIFSCADSYQLRGLSNQTKGIAGLAKTTTSLHAQLSTQFKLPHKFAVCLPSTSDYIIGHMFIGGGPYIYPPYNKDIAKELITAQLVINPISTAPIYTRGDPSDEYFIEPISVGVDHKLLSFNTSLLSIDAEGYGGLKLSTRTPFTVLQTSIYKSLVSEFTKAAALKKMKRAASVAPFEACYYAKTIATSHTGPVVPIIDIGLAGNQQWKFYGANSMVLVNKKVFCLAFVDGGLYPRSSIEIGGHQMENYLIEFDLVSAKLGISNPLSLYNTTCSQSRVM